MKKARSPESDLAKNILDTFYKLGSAGGNAKEFTLITVDVVAGAEIEPLVGATETDWIDDVLAAVAAGAAITMAEVSVANTVDEAIEAAPVLAAVIVALGIAAAVPVVFTDALDSLVFVTWADTVVATKARATINSFFIKRSSIKAREITLILSLICPITK